MGLLVRDDASPRLWLEDTIHARDVLRELIRDCNSSNEHSKIQLIYPQVDKILVLLESSEALDLDNQGLARFIVKELEQMIYSANNSEALDLLVRLCTLDEDLWGGNLPDLGSVLNHATLSHLNRLENESADSQHHLDKALEYHMQAQSADPFINDTVVFHKIAVIGDARMKRASSGWEQNIDDYLPTNPPKDPRLNPSKIDRDSMEDFDIGLRCMSYLPPHPLGGNAEHKHDSGYSSPTSKGQTPIEAISTPVIHDTGTWRQEILRALYELRNLQKNNTRCGGDISAFLAPFFKVLTLLEESGPLSNNDQTIRTSASNFLTHTLLSSAGPAFDHNPLITADLVVRSCSLTADSWPEHRRDQRLGAVLEAAIRVHLRQILNTPGATGTSNLDTALKYYAQLVSLDYSGNSAEIAQMLAQCSQMQTYAAPETIEPAIGQECFTSAVSSQDYSTALEWLEHDRSFFWNQALRLRTPLDQLQAIEPTIACRLKQLSAEIHHAGMQIPNHGGHGIIPQLLEAATRRHRQATEEYNHLIHQVRTIPEFRNFLRPMRASELLRAAQTGPIVIINVSTSSSDAFILIPGHNDVSHLSLPVSTGIVEAAYNFLSESLVLHGERDRGVHKFGATRREVANQALERVLGFLWDGVAQPVLEFLGFLGTFPPESPPRLTWCTSGHLSLLPLHAAGYYDRPRSKISDFVVSSYIPTLSALLFALSAPTAPHSQLLAIGQEACTEHSLSLLPGARRELASIKAHAKESIMVSQINGSDASCEMVLESMEQSDWIHLACHAKSDTDNPVESGFFLADGLLSLEKILQRGFGGKGLAFLSGCQTAKGRGGSAYEAVHLASGMLLAGCRSVIATMWSVSDADVPGVADEVYQRLLKDGKMNYQDSARALHEASNVLRESVGEQNFTRWVPYMHIGV